MIRKLTIALAATAALGAAALAPTAASAFPHFHHGWHHWHGGFGVGLYGPDYGPDCYVVRRIVDTPWGPRARRVTVCD